MNFSLVHMLKKISVVCILASLMLIMYSANVFAYSFSADIVTTAGKNTFSGKMYISDSKARFETAEAISISRMDKKVVWLLMPSEKMYMEQPLKPENIVPSAEKIEGEVERVFLGNEVIDGRQTSKYRISVVDEGKKQSVLTWIADDLGIPVKTAAEDGKWIQEYRNIIIGQIASDLFEIPAGYSRFTMPKMF